MGSHQSPTPQKVVWLSPPEIITALGGPDSFDLDPCAAPMPQPWPTARRMNAEADQDGLSIDWEGRVWLNPPYSTSVIPEWLNRLAAHDCGTALIFARTETETFRRFVWECASGLLFLFGRLNFYHSDGQRAEMNAGAPSVLCAYGQDDLDRLAASSLDGALVPLRFARFVMVDGPGRTWGEIMSEWMARQGETVSVSDAYRFFARHPKARSNPNWQAKVRQQLQLHGRRVSRGLYRPRQLAMDMGITAREDS